MFPDLARDEVFRLETRRLWLRWPRPQDVACLADGASDRAVAEKTLDLPHPYPEGAAAEYVLTARKANADGRALSLALALKGRPGAAIGCIDLAASSERLARLSFWLARPHWGHGLMTEALHGLMEVTFNFTDFLHVEAVVRGLNPAALRVLAHAGFLPGSGETPGGPKEEGFPAERFRLDRRRWRAGRSAASGSAGEAAGRRAGGIPG